MAAGGSTKIRARIGYTSVAFVTEIFPRAFYEIVPDGVVLQILTQQVTSHASRNMERIHEEAQEAVSSFVRAGADMVILGGAPTNLSLGTEALAEALQALSDEAGIPVSSSATAQRKALEAVGARTIGVVHPSNAGRDEAHIEQMAMAGFNAVASRGAGAAFEGYNRIPDGEAYRLGCELVAENPEIDTLLFSCPHWAVSSAVEALEQECDVTVVTSLHAIIREGLRGCGIEDRLSGHGRLLREF